SRPRRLYSGTPSLKCEYWPSPFDCQTSRTAAASGDPSVNRTVPENTSLSPGSSSRRGRTNGRSCVGGVFGVVDGRSHEEVGKVGNLARPRRLGQPSPGEAVLLPRHPMLDDDLPQGVLQVVEDGVQAGGHPVPRAKS